MPDRVRLVDCLDNIEGTAATPLLIHE